MKAEHRKELQTNALADRMGKLLTTVKQKPRGRSVFYWLLALVAVVVVLIFWFARERKQTLLAEQWLMIDLSQKAEVATLGNQYPDSNPGKAARFQWAWVRLWDRGLLFLGAEPGGALQNIRKAQEEFTLLAEECKDDPVLAPQALYCAATAEEAQTVSDAKRLASALQLYKDLADRFPESAHGKAAAERVKFLEVEANRTEVEAWYARLREDLNVGMHELIHKFQKEQRAP